MSTPTTAPPGTPRETPAARETPPPRETPLEVLREVVRDWGFTCSAFVAEELVAERASFYLHAEHADTGMTQVAVIRNYGSYPCGLERRGPHADERLIVHTPAQLRARLCDYFASDTVARIARWYGAE